MNIPKICFSSIVPVSAPTVPIVNGSRRRMRMDKAIPVEVYSLTLTHYIQDDNGRHNIEEPLVMRTYVDRSNMIFPICVNEIVEKMMQMMRDKLLSTGER